MIKIGNLIQRTIALVDLTNNRYFKRYELLFRKLNVWNFELRILNFARKDFYQYEVFLQA